ncbi:MAG: RNA polymerase sigma factor [Gemmatimonadales bacterium]
MRETSLGVATLSDQREGQPLATDAVDVTLAASGDGRAFERLYRSHVARVHSLARRMMGGDEEADDVTQDIFVRAWQKLGTFRGEAAFSTWLHRLAVNVILTRRQTASAMRGRFVDDDAPVDRQAARTARPDLSVDFEQAIEQVPDGARQVFVLHDVEGYKHEEIARMLSITSGTSKSQLHRARLMLRRHLA